MIKTSSLINILKKNNITFFSGVPDSVLKELSNYLSNFDEKKHIIAPNEGAAVSIAIGNYLSTKKIPCVYMQNSGLSNAINPLISLAHKKVYKIPLILIIGWRGSPNNNDEPQHQIKGEITKKILKLLNINYEIIRTNKNLKNFDKKIKKVKKNNEILACLIENGTLTKDISKNIINSKYKLTKDEFYKSFLKIVGKKTKIISSTGFNSRDLLFYENQYKFLKRNCFYLVGGMGHTSSVALGYSINTSKKVICLDGDGSLLMHLGSLNTVGKFAKKNFKYILLNNNSHESVGGQKTYADNLNFEKFSKSVRFKKYMCIDNKIKIDNKLKKFLNTKNYNFLEVKLAQSKKKKLPRPSNLIDIKNSFMKL